MGLVLRRPDKDVFVPVDLPGDAFIRVRPATQTDVDVAAAAAQRALVGLSMGGEAAEVLAAIFGDAFNVDALADNDNFVTAGQRLAEAHMVLLCQDGWEGVVEIVGEGESGRQVPIELTLGSIALLLDDPACRALVLKVVNASIHEAQAEKNGSSASPDGAGEAGSGTAPPAGHPASLAPSADQAATENSARS